MKQPTKTNNSNKYLIGGVIIVILIVAIIGIVYYLRHHKVTHEYRLTTGTDNLAVWVPDWASAPGLDSIKRTGSLFTEVSPIWYAIKADGGIVNSAPKEESDIITAVRANNSNLIPTISELDFQVLAKVLRSDINLSNHVNAIATEVENKGYDGIDLDYQSIQLSDKDMFYQFLQQLSQKLHDNKKLLIVSVLPKWGDKVSYQTLKETRQVQDWSTISKYADYIRIMSYGYTDTKSVYPGPIAPMSWLKQILDYAVAKIPKEKIELGVPLFSDEWWVELAANQKTTANQASDPLKFVQLNTKNPQTNTQGIRSYSYDVVQRVLAKYQGTTTTYEGEKIFRYQKTNDQTQKSEDRVLVYLDREGISSREQLAKDYGIRGVSYWSLGGEQGLLAK